MYINWVKVQSFHDCYVAIRMGIIVMSKIIDKTLIIQEKYIGMI